MIELKYACMQTNGQNVHFGVDRLMTGAHIYCIQCQCTSKSTSPCIIIYPSPINEQFSAHSIIGYHVQGRSFQIFHYSVIALCAAQLAALQIGLF